MYYVLADNPAATMRATFDTEAAAYAFARIMAQQFRRVELHHNDRCVCVFRARK